MPNPFRFFALRSFPDAIERRPYVVPRQLKIGSADAEDTELRWQESLRSGSRKLDRLEIQHDVLIESSGRVPVDVPNFGSIIERFDAYIATYHLEAYVTEARDLLLVEGPGGVVRDAYRTLRDHADSITIAQSKIDFEALSPHLAGIRGAWFSRTAGPLSALALFGHAVTDSPEWGEAKLTSDIRSLMVQHGFDGALHTIMITSDAGVVVYENLARDKLLGLVFDVHDTLLVHALEPPDFSGNREAPRGLRA
jgi:hypothetical protein